MTQRKVWSIISRVITWILIAFTVTMLAFTIITLAMGRKNASIFGRRAFIVLTDSMSDTFQAGDIVICAEVDPATLVEGDIISFTCMDPDSEAYGQVITHKIKAKTTDAAGNPVFQTYGTTTGDLDQELVYYNHVMGKYSFRIPNVGNFIEWMRTPLGYVLVIGLPFGALIATQVVNVVRAYRMLKESERSEMDAEREQIATERAQMNQMMEELQRMRAEMGIGDIPPPTAPTQQSEINQSEQPPQPVAQPAAAQAPAAPQPAAAPQFDPQMMQQLMAMMQAQMAQQNAQPTGQEPVAAQDGSNAKDQSASDETAQNGRSPSNAFGKDVTANAVPVKFSQVLIFKEFPTAVNVRGGEVNTRNLMDRFFYEVIN
jgi:signal peptidase